MCIETDKKAIPTEARLMRGRVAVCLCPGQDKCGLCVSACGFGAIEKPDRLPLVEHDECIGCGACVKACPRGNMRLVDFTKSGDTAELTLKLPHIDPPEEGAELALVGENGAIGRGKVLQAYPLANGGTSVRIRAEKGLAFCRFAVEQP